MVENNPSSDLTDQVVNVVGKSLDMVQSVVVSMVEDVEQSGIEEFTFFNYCSSFVVHILLIVVVIGLKYQYDRNRYRLPSGPHKLKHLYSSWLFHRNKRENLLKLSKQYPQMCTIRTHLGKVILLNDPLLINEIFVGRADLCSQKIDHFLENQLRYKHGKHQRTGIIFRHHDYNSQLIHRTLVDHLTEIKFDYFIQCEFSQLKLYLEQNATKFNVQETMFRLSVHILTTICLSRTFIYDLGDKTFETFTKDLFDLSAAIHEDSIQKTWGRMFLSEIFGYPSELLKLNKLISSQVQLWVDQRLDQRKISTFSGHSYPHDVLSSLFEIVEKSSPHIDNEDLAAILVDIIMHGSEMMKCALTWLLLYTVKYPQETELARQEVKTLHYNSFTLKTVDELLYCRAYVKEVLRLSPVVPVLLHSTLEDFTWRGFHIEKRTLFGANLYGLHHCEQHWGVDVEKFNVDRWRIKEGDVEILYRDYYQPSLFGLGPRQCVVGENYLLNILTGLFATMLNHFRFEQYDSLPEPNEGTFGITNIPPMFSLKLKLT
ncbi:unnamed protein product [Didymodactylos carnosus]|uniref:Cytochrome P450 n=2 Tax=Didymodactylos carnosus TaxID=1234261 RepID=A0A814HR96_9BILA|nr:unnamed protein product [Didymodactylos carnosus]CAF3784999.1 unnamed protein product [Didymodactylos carnosus]